MKILLCDDQIVIRDGLEMLLNLEKDFQVVGAAQDGVEAVEITMQNQPDLILMDLRMPIMNGIEATREIHAKFPAIKILVLTTYDDDEWVFDAIRAGASGYLLKDTSRQKIVEAIRGTMEGKSFIDPAIATKLLNHFSNKQTQPTSMLADKLTKRELDVLRLIAKGVNNNDIANQLHLSEGTVRNRVSVILEKLNVSDRTQAALIAIQHGLQ
ncbi:MAG: response regulator transcription factor [Anaerolineales bacterium]|nr:response regulator transcription factor [Anaerolineales bacterium]